MKIMRKKHGDTRSIGIKMNICEDARTSWCQKGTYVRLREPVGVKSEHM